MKYMIFRPSGRPIETNRYKIIKEKSKTTKTVSRSDYSVPASISSNKSDLALSYYFKRKWATDDYKLALMNHLDDPSVSNIRFNSDGSKYTYDKEYINYYVEVKSIGDIMRLVDIFNALIIRFDSIMIYNESTTSHTDLSKLKKNN